MPDLEDRVAALEAIVAGLMPAEPDFMSQVRADAFRDTEVRALLFTHEPTGIQVLADSRPEAVIKLRKALTARAGRHASWAGGIPGAA